MTKKQVKAVKFWTLVGACVTAFACAVSFMWWIIAEIGKVKAWYDVFSILWMTVILGFVVYALVKLVMTTVATAKRRA